MKNKKTILSELQQRCQSAIPNRYSPKRCPQAKLRLEHELVLIGRLGKSENFLIAAAMATFADKKRIQYRLVGPGCGSVVAYLLGLSGIDPLRHGLLFERFCGGGRRRANRFLLRVEPGRKEELLGSADRAFGKDAVDRATLLSDLTVEEMIPRMVVSSLGHERAFDGDFGKAARLDADAVAVLCSEETAGIFQLHRAAVRRAFARLRPKHVRDVAAITAIAATGARRRALFRQFTNRETFQRYPQPVRHDILQLLRESRGTILYQEQVMNLLHWFGEIPLADGYRFVRAASRGDREPIDEFGACFRCHADRDGMDAAVAESLFDSIAEAAVYARCKANEYANAVLTCRAAWLKAHWPAEFDRVARSLRDPEGR
ncbi:MAG: hypothetical protein GXY83_02965 [Rhodopirellula sp.]|nr:hypothetical protein [Rhodopirellula sp.]